MATIDLPRYDWIRRGIRTFLQAFVGMLALLMTPLLQELINAVRDGRPVSLEFDAFQSVLIAATAAGVIALVAFVQNLLEDTTSTPAVLKGQASIGQNPTPDPVAENTEKPTSWVDAEIERALQAPPETHGVNRKRTIPSV